MKKVSPLSIGLIVIVALAAIWYIFPSLNFYMRSPEERIEMIADNPQVTKKVINLGLDLQGGMRLVLEVDTTGIPKDARKDLLDRAYTIIENRINGLGVSEPSIQKQGKYRLIIELPGLQDANAAKDILGSTAQLEFKLVHEPADLDKAIRTIDAVLKGELLTETDSGSIVDSSAIANKENQKQAESLLAGSEDKKDVEISDAVAVEDDGEEIVKTLREYLVSVQNQIGAKESDRGKVTKILERKDVQDELKKKGLGGSHFLWGHETEVLNNGEEIRSLYFLKKRAELKGDIIKDAQYETAQGGLQAGQAIVSLEMNSKGAQRFRRVTGANVNKYLAIVLDSTVYSAPQIQQKISQGRAQITGSFTPEKAKRLAIVLRAGALPAPVQIIEERTVGPSLGQESIQKAATACIIGFLIVVVFMLVYYKTAGLIANFALLLNLVFVLAIMSSLGATLTLPGIAGLILIMGMAIDANVIIFERIREELAIGKTIRSAVNAGYDRAFVTIMDANITTLFTAAILMWVGTGPIKGFAVTMIIGILVSLFTALFMTRIVFNFITSSRKLKKLSI